MASNTSFESPWKLNYSDSGCNPIAMKIKVSDYLYSTDKSLSHDIIYFDSSSYTTSTGVILTTKKNISETDFRGIALIPFDSDSQTAQDSGILSLLWLSDNMSKVIYPIVSIYSSGISFGDSNTSEIQLSNEDVSVKSLNPASAVYNRKIFTITDKLATNYPAINDSDYLWVICSFYGDYINKNSFNQELNQFATVIHGDLTVNSITATSGIFTDNLVDSEIISDSLDGVIKATSGITQLGNTESISLITAKSKIKTGNKYTSDSNKITSILSTKAAIDNTWKNTNNNFSIENRIIDDANINDYGAIDNTIQYASILQYAGKAKEWQLGAATELNLTDSVHYLSDINSGADTPLKGFLPAVVRLDNSDMTIVDGGILFKKPSNTSRSLMSSDSAFKYSNNILYAPTIQAKSTGNISSSLTGLRLQLGLDTTSDTFATSTTLRSVYQINSVSKIHAIDSSLSDGKYQVSLFKTTAVNNNGTNTPLSGTYYNVLSINSEAKQGTYNNPILHLSQYSNNPGKTSGKDWFITYIEGDELHIGNTEYNLTDIQLWGTSTFNKQVIIGGTYSRDNSALTRGTKTISTGSWVGSVNKETAAYGLSTFTRIDSPTIDEIWIYLKQIVDGTLPVVSDSFNDTTLTYTLSSDILADINSYIDPDLVSIDSFTPNTSGSVWYASTTSTNTVKNPLSLRELEYKILGVRYDLITYANFVTHGKVDKGNSQDSGSNHGSLFQVHQNETPWTSTSNTILRTADLSATHDIEDVYLAADGTWRYLFDQTRIQILDE